MNHSEFRTVFEQLSGNPPLAWQERLFHDHFATNDLRRDVERQKREGWGRATVERLVDDLQKAFPGTGDFSRTNIFKMRAFYLAYKDGATFVPHAAGRISGRRKVPHDVGQIRVSQPPEEQSS